MACLDPVTGEVRIPHFYDDVVPPTEEELDNFVASGFDVERFRKTYGFRWLRTEDPRELLKRIWAWPTFEVHGIAGGYQGPGIKTVIPHWAEAKVSMRLVPNQVPEKVFQLLADYVRQLNPLVEVRPHGSLAPYIGEFKGPHADALRRAVRRALGVEPAFIREGGSIGAVLTMKKLLDVPILMMGLSLPEHGYHAPNEYFDWDQARRGIEIFNYYFEELVQLYR
jgi:acetylornithine deacetylase/succinyl-diaminopimelate desuccinylase-like protein